MLLVQTQRDALLRPLQVVAGIVERRQTLPILANILLRKQGNSIALISSDIEIQISTQANIGIGNEDVATTVAARKLLDILKAVPESENINLTLADKKLGLNAGKSKFKLQTLAAEDFPIAAQPEHYPVSLELTQKTLRHLFSMVHFSMAQQDIRYYLNGLLLATEGQQVKAVATDGHRLALCSAQVAGATQPKNDAIIPRKTVLEMLRLLGEVDEPVQVNIASNQIRFSFNDIELVSKLVEGKFPDFNRVIPSGYGKTFQISRLDLLAALQRVSILTSDKLRVVRMTFADNKLLVTSTNADQEDAQEELDIEFNYDRVEIGFNVGYLLDVLGNVKNEQVQISLGDSNSSALITLPGDDSFKYVVMPMRI
jgi:DNA polymerase-3 subunit beta